MAREKKWVTALLAPDHKAKISKAIGMPVGKVLGCGHWGCVADLPGPWVLKLTVDPTEAHIWIKIRDLVEEEAYGGDGIVHIKQVYELSPPLEVGKRKRRAYAIVREEIEPVFKAPDTHLTDASLRMLELDPAAIRREHGPKSFVIVTDKELKIIPGRNAPWESWSTVPATHRIDNFVQTIRGISRYRMQASSYHRAQKDPHGVDAGSGRIDRVEATTSLMNGPIGGYVGETLSMLLSNEIVLNDVHLGNIGWRAHAEPHCIVIFDPGHTPTAKSPVEQKIEWNPAGGATLGREDAEMHITTDHKWHDFKTRDEVPPKVLAGTFDYQGEDVYDGYIKHRGYWYHLDQFMRVPNTDDPALSAWDGYLNDSISTGMLLKVSKDGEQYMIASFAS